MFREELKTQNVRENVNRKILMFREELKTRKDRCITMSTNLENQNLENETVVTENKDVNVEQKDVKEPTVQELMVEIAKLKRGLDKASSEAADYKKKYNATLSEKEQADLEKAEREAEKEEKFNQLLRENSINKLEKNFVLLGYNEEQAHKAATAQYDGNTDELFKIQSEVQQTLVKAKEAEWLKNRPLVNSGGVNDKEVDPFLQGFNM